MKKRNFESTIISFPHRDSKFSFYFMALKWKMLHNILLNRYCHIVRSTTDFNLEEKVLDG